MSGYVSTVTTLEGLVETGALPKHALKKRAAGRR